MWIDTERLIHSFKTALACLLGFAITKALHSYLFFDQWLIVTILVVMCAQLSVGSLVFKSSVRFIGTCIGSLLTALTLITFSDDPFMYALVIAFAGMIASYIATGPQSYSDAATLGAVTTAIILINPNPTLSLTAERFLEITIGIIVATLVSHFVLPIHARTHLKRNQAQALKLFSDYYSQATLNPAANKEKMTELDEAIVQSLMTQRKLAKEAKRELLGSRFEPDRFQKIMDCEKSILRSIDFLNRMYSELNLYSLLDKNLEWQTFNKTLAALFKKIAERVEEKQTGPFTLAIPSVSQLEDALANELATQENAKNIKGLFFCLEHLTHEIRDLTLAVS
jgi:uncharacterized membrane protein YccC